MMSRKWFITWWVVLLLALAGAAGGFALRFGNDADNMNLITSVDYYMFEEYAAITGQDVDAVLAELQARGIGAVAVKEMSLFQLSEQGALQLMGWGEFSAQADNQDPEQWAAIQSETSGRDITALNQVAFTRDEQTAILLRERLPNRFADEDLLFFELDGVYYAIITAELNSLTPRSGTNEDPPLDNRVGFDENLIAGLKQQGFEVILRPGDSMGSELDYVNNEIEPLITRYDIKYMIFDGIVVPGFQISVEPLAQLAVKHDLITGIIEASDQLQYMEQRGLEQYMELVDYDINRAYSTSFDEYLIDTNERFFRWVRAVVDRSIRILYLTPFQNSKLPYSENLDNSYELVGKFHETIADKGYVLNEPLNHLNNSEPGRLHRTALCLSLLAGGLLYLSYLRLKKNWLLVIAALGILATLGANLVLNMDLAKVYALGAAVLYPALSTLLLLYYLKDNDQGMFKKMLVSAVLLLSVNALGMYTVVSSLSSVYYTMNVGIFSGVKVAFLLPLLLFIVHYLVVFFDWEGLKEKTAVFLKEHVTWLGLGLVFILAAMGYYYIARTGHTEAVSVSALEVRVREILEMIFLARPRFKELLIGWPCLFALVYLYHRYRYSIIVLLLGFGVTMLSMTMVNSFCHVYTAIGISAFRTLAGLISGIAVAVLGIIAIRILERLLDKWLAPLREI
ncbi:MAG: DUF5693 family protein [Syntrophomonadaceae bacterium]|nr:DUF5693 family protein [Syntrophomonadaceae bacterium]